MAKLTVEFNEHTNKLLQDLADEVGTTKVDVIRKALSVYKYLQDEVKDGSKKVSISSKDGNVLKDVIIR